MNGYLRVWSLEGEWRLELPQADCWLADEGGVPQLLADHDAQAVAGISWDGRSCRWLVKLPLEPGGDPADGASVVPGRGLLQAGTWLIELHRVPGAPVEEGRESAEVRLDSRVAVMGRSSPDLTEGDGRRRVLLDGQDFTISKNHVALEPEGHTWLIRDLSKTGAELNGQAFGSERLVFGDRFRIGAYNFDFTGTSVAWVRQEVNIPVVASGVCVDIGERRILHEAALAVRRGDFVGVLGGSGSGKSTLLSVLCGIRRPSEGSVLLDGVPLESADTSDVGFVPQDDIVHTELTVEQALRFSARLRLRLGAGQISDLVDHTLRRIGLEEHRKKPIKVLSGGQRKRVSIATELLTKPSLLYLDEPSSGLDPNTEEGLMSMLQSLTVTGLTVICTTHVLQKAYLFDRLCFIQKGRVIFWGTVSEAGAHFFPMGGDPSSSDGFQRTPLERIYGLLEESGRTEQEWEDEFRASEAGRRRDVEASLPPSRPAGGGAEARLKRPRPGFLTKLGVLLARQAAILRADPLNLGFLLAQAVIIGALAGWVTSDVSLRTFLCVVATLWFGCSNGAQQIVAEIAVFRRETVCGLSTRLYLLGKYIFLCVLTTAQALLLFGVASVAGNGVHNRDFDAERFMERLEERLEAQRPARASAGTGEAAGFAPLDEDGFMPLDEEAGEVGGGGETVESARERKTRGLWLLRFLAKWQNLEQNILESGPRAMLDEAGRVIEDELGQPMRTGGQGVWQVVFMSLFVKGAALVVTAAFGVAAGLTISALVRSNTQAVMWVPLILIPQILFGGYVVRVADMTPSARAFCQAMPSYLCQQMMDVGNLYGQATPFLSNRTKTALFLTTDGAKETVRWTEGEREMSQTYDMLSDFNTSWQNLLIDPERTGEHKWDRIPGTSQIRDTTTQRRDVRYQKGAVFRYPGPAVEAGMKLGVWALICVGLTFFGLYRQRRMI